MAVDQTLIQGAGLAAKSDSSISGGIKRSQAVAKIGKQLTDAAISHMNTIGEQRLAQKQEKEEVEKENEDKGAMYDAAAQKILNDAELPQAEWDALYDELQLNRDAYINGTEKEKAQAIRDLNMKARSYVEYKEFRSQIADAYNNKNSGFSASWEGPVKDDIIALMEDQSRLVPKKCTDQYGEPIQGCTGEGDMGVMIHDEEKAKKVQEAEEMISRMENPDDEMYHLPDEEYAELISQYEETIKEGSKSWRSMADLKVNELNKALVDTKTRERVASLGDQLEQLSAGVIFGQEGSFESKEAWIDGKIKENILGGAQNMDSLIYDTMIGGPDATSFYDRLQEHIHGKTYQELGIDESLIIDPTPGVDVDGDGVDDETGEPIGISEEDAKQIADTLLSDETLRNEALTQYLKQHFKDKWNSGANLRVIPEKDKKITYNSKGQAVFSDK